MKICFDEIGQQYVTFFAGETAAEGKVCKMGGNETVAACAAGEDFCGAVSEVRGGAASVMMTGYCELPYTGAAPAVGYAKLVADAAGGVAISTTGGKSYLVVNVDTAGKTVGLFL